MQFTPELLGATCSLLFALNLFFIKRLIDKIDSTATSASATRTSLKLLTSSVRSAGRELEQIKSELKEIRRFEADIAVLKSWFDNSGIQHS